MAKELYHHLYHVETYEIVPVGKEIISRMIKIARENPNITFRCFTDMLTVEEVCATRQGKIQIPDNLMIQIAPYQRKKVMSQYPEFTSMFEH